MVKTLLRGQFQKLFQQSKNNQVRDAFWVVLATLGWCWQGNKRKKMQVINEQ